MTGFTLRALDQGARLVRETRASRDLRWMRAESARFETTQGSFATRTAGSDAAGAWSAEIAKMAGIDLPVEPLRRMLVPTEPFEQSGAQRPDGNRYVLRVSFPA